MLWPTCRCIFAGGVRRILSFDTGVANVGEVSLELGQPGARRFSAVLNAMAGIGLLSAGTTRTLQL